MNCQCFLRGGPKILSAPLKCFKYSRISSLFIAKDKTRFRSCFKQCKETKLDVIANQQEWETRCEYFKSQLDFHLRCDIANLPEYDLYYFFDDFDTTVLPNVARKREFEEITTDST